MRAFDNEVKRRCADCHEEIIIERSNAVINAVAFCIAERCAASGAAMVLKNRGAAVAKALAGEDTGPESFDLDAMPKDLRTMLEEGKSLGGGTAHRGYELD